jgi:hypothetical protein
MQYKRFSVNLTYMEILEQQTIQPKYSLTEEQERKEIVRQYRALLRVLKPCAGKAGNPIYFIRWLFPGFVWRK